MEDKKNTLFKFKKAILLIYGYKNKKIKPIDEEVYNRLRNYYFASMPIKFYIKYFVPKLRPGNCEERSYLLSFGFDDCEIVMGHLKSLEIKYGKENDYHFWVESNGKCYDPSSLLETDRNLFYQIEGVTNTSRINKEQIASTGIAKYINSLSLDVYKNDEFRRRDLELLMPLILASEEYKVIEEFRLEYNEFLSSLGYKITEEEKLNYL